MMMSAILELSKKSGKTQNFLDSANSQFETMEYTKIITFDDAIDYLGPVLFTGKSITVNYDRHVYADKKGTKFLKDDNGDVFTIKGNHTIENYLFMKRRDFPVVSNWKIFGGRPHFVVHSGHTKDGLYWTELRIAVFNGKHIGWIVLADKARNKKIRIRFKTPTVFDDESDYYNALLEYRFKALRSDLKAKAIGKTLVGHGKTHFIFRRFEFIIAVLPKGIDYWASKQWQGKFVFSMTKTFNGIALVQKDLTMPAIKKILQLHNRFCSNMRRKMDMLEALCFFINEQINNRRPELVERYGEFGETAEFVLTENERRRKQLIIENDRAILQEEEPPKKKRRVQEKDDEVCEVVGQKTAGELASERMKKAENDGTMINLT